MGREFEILVPANLYFLRITEVVSLLYYLPFGEGVIMSKICIVSISAPRNMIMLYMYTSYLSEQKIDFDIFYLDKYHEEETTGAANTYRVEYERNNKMDIIKGYLNYKRQAEFFLKKEKYEFVIVWGELTAAVLSKVLVKCYRGKYCINVRDLFVGKRTIFYPLLNRAIKMSAFTTVSSEKYLEKLPKKDSHYLFVHSINDRIINETLIAKRDNSVRDDSVIRILFIGNIRFLNHLYWLINQVKNDDRYQVIVAGVGSEPVHEYILSNDIKNVLVYGTFKKEQTGEFLSKADVIYNLYGTEDVNLKYALSNKLYYAICLNLPILVYRDTYMYTISNKCGIGFAVDEERNQPFGDQFINWYKQIDRTSIMEKCAETIDEAQESQVSLYEELKKHIP